MFDFTYLSHWFSCKFFVCIELPGRIWNYKSPNVALLICITFFWKGSLYHTNSSNTRISRSIVQAVERTRAAELDISFTDGSWVRDFCTTLASLPIRTRIATGWFLKNASTPDNSSDSLEYFTLRLAISVFLVCRGGAARQRLCCSCWTSIWFCFQMLYLS